MGGGLTLRGESLGELWVELLAALLYRSGGGPSPRGMPTSEIVDAHLELTDPLANIVAIPARRLAYKFMVAEWLWIWFGRRDVATMARYNPNIAQFSDDGITFAGAYGPPVALQWHRVKRLLERDPDTRQAVLSIYRPPRGETKDVPCTLAVQFLLRDGRLRAIVSMRSSDVWLGLPYDFFTFSMLQNVMAAEIAAGLGPLDFNLGSSHLYARNLLVARAVLASDDRTTMRSPLLPGEPPRVLENVLIDPFVWETAVVNSPWDRYVKALIAPTNRAALEELR